MLRMNLLCYKLILYVGKAVMGWVDRPRKQAILNCEIKYCGTSIANIAKLQQVAGKPFYTLATIIFTLMLALTIDKSRL